MALVRTKHRYSCKYTSPEWHKQRNYYCRLPSRLTEEQARAYDTEFRHGMRRILRYRPPTLEEVRELSLYVGSLELFQGALKALEDRVRAERQHRTPLGAFLALEGSEA